MAFMLSLSLSILNIMLLLLCSSLRVPVVVVSGSSSTDSVAARCHEDEMSALLQFKNSFTISKVGLFYNALESWKAGRRNRSSDCCSWDGVDCDEETGHVIALELLGIGLFGGINSSSSLFKLVHLRRIDLSYNDFNKSQIPYGFGLLSNLTHLCLSYSKFSGEIPSDIFTLTRLVSLDLGSNSVHIKRAGMASLFRNLTNLQGLYLDRIDILSPIPDAIANMSSLKDLSLWDVTGLYGALPSSIFQLPKLEVLVVSVLSETTNVTVQFPVLNSTSSLQSLYLAGLSFANELPASIGNLHALKEILIGLCKSVRAIPSSFGNLSELTYLEFTDINIGAQNLHSMSWLWKLMNLAQLGLSWMNLHGEIPHQLMNLTELKFLSLDSNKLEGPIPSSISHLQELENLDLSENQLSGTVELNIFLNLKNMWYLSLSNNKLTCRLTTNTTLSQFEWLELGACNLREFPSFLKNQSELWYLDLSDNNIHGQVPKWMGNVSVNSLYFMNLSHNFLTGFDLPPVNLPWKSLHTLDLTYNTFLGALPEPHASIQYYLVSNNNLTGALPQWICNKSSLVVLDLSSNELSGTLPRCMDNIGEKLLALDLQRNRFHGSIPQFCASGMHLIRMIALSHNGLQGKLPRTLANCSMLEFVDLGNNRINDTFPSWLEALAGLEVLILRNNQIHGAMERISSVAFPKLRIIDVSHNNLNGAPPEGYFQAWSSMKLVNRTSKQIGYMGGIPSYNFHVTLTTKGYEIFYPEVFEGMISVDLSCNKFEGEIPAALGDLKALYSLNLSNNFLSGQIPSSIGSLTELESLDLAHNKLSGEIPEELDDLNFLSYLDVSFNDLSGPIPMGQQFTTFPKTTFEGNPGLCGDVIFKPCAGFHAGTSEPTLFNYEDNWNTWMELDWKIVLLGYGSGIVVGLVIGNAYASRKPDWFMEVIRRLQDYR